MNISDGSSVFDYFFWPDSEAFQSSRFGNEPEDLTTIDINAIGDTTFDEQFAATCNHDADSPLLSKPSPAIRSSDSQSLDPVPCQKRLQDCLYEFEGGPNTAPSRRKRRKFSSERRNEVYQIRKVGACIRCKLTKSSVSSSTTSAHCCYLIEASVSLNFLAHLASKRPAIQTQEEPSAFAKVSSTFDSL